MQAKEARQKDKTTVLSGFFDKWVQTLRTKMALKAVARARYLRLPTAAPRKAITHSHAVPTTTPSTTPLRFPRKPAESIVDDDVGGSSRSRSRIRPTISPRSHSRASVSKTPLGDYHTRNSSPTRSTGRPPSLASSLRSRGEPP